VVQTSHTLFYENSVRILYEFCERAWRVFVGREAMVVMLSVVDGRDVVIWSHRCASAYQRQDKVTVTTTPSAPLSRPFPLPLPLQLATVAATSNSTVMYCPSYRDRHRHIHCLYTAVEASLHQSAVHVSRVQSMSPECSLWRQSAIHAFAAIQIVIGIRLHGFVCHLGHVWVVQHLRILKLCRGLRISIV
jgi:hypothetical protein